MMILIFHFNNNQSPLLIEGFILDNMKDSVEVAKELGFSIRTITNRASRLGLKKVVVSGALHKVK